jgi:hypothetical protein
LQAVLLAVSGSVVVLGLQGGAELAVFDLGDRIRADFYRRIGFEDLLSPAGACQG